jgi:hypothetical protein
MAGFSSRDRKLVVALIGLLVVVFALVGSNVAANHEPKPHDVPIGIFGSPPAVTAVESSLRRTAPGAYKSHRYASLASARSAILDRRVYGAYRPSSPALLLVASAASSSVSALLEQTFRTVAGKQHKALVVRDLVPLPRSDPRGGTAFSAVVSLIITGVLGSSIIFLLGTHRPPALRLATGITLAIGAGLITALLTNVIIKAFPGEFLGVWGVATLYVLALILPISAFQVFVGIAGTAIGAVMFLVIGNPASGGGTAPELLPGFWRALSQFLPPGAAITAMRDVVYFHGHGMTHAISVLAVYAFLGGTIALAESTLRARSKLGEASPHRREPATASS